MTNRDVPPNADPSASTDPTVDLDWRVEPQAGVALVALVVANPTPAPRRVRVANRLDGPVHPPRREGVPEAGWDDGGFEGVVAPGATRPLGYACPAEPAEPPVEVVWTERAAATERGYGGKAEDAVADEPTAIDDDPTPESVVRALGTARPPADAVPTGAPASGTAGPSDADAPATDTASADADLPDPVASWLAGVAERATRRNDGTPAPTDDDRAALAAAARRIEALRHPGADAPTPEEANVATAEEAGPREPVPAEATSREADPTPPAGDGRSA